MVEHKHHDKVLRFDQPSVRMMRRDDKFQWCEPRRWSWVHSGGDSGSEILAAAESLVRTNCKFLLTSIHAFNLGAAGGIASFCGADGVWVATEIEGCECTCVLYLRWIPTWGEGVGSTLTTWGKCSRNFLSIRGLNVVASAPDLGGTATQHCDLPTWVERDYFLDSN